MEKTRSEKISLRPQLKYWITYKNENYDVKDVLAELIDNSYSSYIKNKKILFENNPNYKLKISIYLDPELSELMVIDNAFGMNFEELKNGIKLQSKQDLNKNISLNEHGLGLKKASIWIADKFKVETKKFNCKFKNIIEVDSKNLKDNIDEYVIDEFEYDRNINDSFTRITLMTVNKNIFKIFDFKNCKKLIHGIKDVYRKILKKEKIELRFAKKQYDRNGYVEYVNLLNKNNFSGKLDSITPIKMDEELKYAFNIDEEKLYKWDFNKEFEVLNDSNKQEKFNINGTIGILEETITNFKNKIFIPGFHFFRNDRKISYFLNKNVFKKTNKNIERIYCEINISDNFQTITTKNKIKWIGDLKEQFIKYINDFSISNNIFTFCSSLNIKNKEEEKNKNQTKKINDFSKKIQEIKINEYKDFKVIVNDFDSNSEPIEIDNINKEIKIGTKNEIFQNYKNTKDLNLLIEFLFKIIKKIKKTHDKKFLNKFLEIIK